MPLCVCEWFVRDEVHYGCQLACKSQVVSDHPSLCAVFSAVNDVECVVVLLWASGLCVWVKCAGE